MKVKKMKVFNILIVLCLTAFIIPMKVLAQELRTNEKGEKIIVYPDGSWKYYDNNKNDTKTTTTDTKKSTSKKVDSDKRSKDADATSKSKNIKPDTKSTDSKKATTSRSSTSKVDPSKNLSLLELKALDDVSKRKCLEFIDKINNEERKLYQAFKEITLSKIAAQAAVTNAYKSNSLVEIQKIESLENDLDQKIKQEKIAKQQYTNFSKLAKKVRALNKITDREKRDKKVASLQKKYKALNSDKNNDNNSDKNDADILASSSKGNTETLKFVEPIDIVKNPPKSACDFKFKGIDDFTGKVKFETHPELWFAYTEPQLKSLMGKNDFITAKASLTGLSGGIFYLILEIEIASKAAPIEFGVLDKGSALSITLMNGEVIKVANRISDPGKVDAINNKTSYEGNFQLELSQIKDLAKSEVDTVRLVWSSGFEDYDVFNVDLLMNAAQCLLDNSK